MENLVRVRILTSQNLSTFSQRRVLDLYGNQNKNMHSMNCNVDYVVTMWWFHMTPNCTRRLQPNWPTSNGSSKARHQRNRTLDTSQPYLKSMDLHWRWLCLDRKRKILTGMYMNRMCTLDNIYRSHHWPQTTRANLTTIHQNPSSSELTDIEQSYCSSGTASNMSLENTCYGPRHPPPTEVFTSKERKRWAVEDQTDIFMNKVIQEPFPEAVMSHCRLKL